MRGKLNWLPVLFALTLAACGGSTVAPASGPASPGGDPLQKLYDSAKAEGQVTVVNPTNADVMTQMAAGFNAKYPSIKVNLSNLTAGQTVERIVTEATANKTSLDV